MITLDMPLVSIFTCVFNRADKIDRVFCSLKRQTYTNIEHIIIDDGSTDDIKAKCNQYIQQTKYPVIFKSKSNGGKHTATNLAWDLAHGDFIIQLDSDDELLPYAIEYLVDLWKKIPEDNLEEYWCVHGRCRTQNSDDLIGDPYPNNINELPFQNAITIAEKCRGEKVGLMRADILNGENYRYPEPVGVKFVTESILWKQLNKKYRTWYSNEIVRIYYVDEGISLSKPKKTTQSMSNKCWNNRWFLLHRKDFKCNLFKLSLVYAFCYPFATQQYKSIWKYKFVKFKDDPILLILLMTFGICGKIVSPFIKKKITEE